MVDTENNGPGISADEAIQRLIDGNERFLIGELPAFPGFRRIFSLISPKDRSHMQRFSDAATREFHRS